MGKVCVGAIQSWLFIASGSNGQDNETMVVMDSVSLLSIKGKKLIHKEW
jgi:hypothetical protein